MAVTFMQSFYRLRVFVHRFQRRLMVAFAIPFAAFVVISFIPTPKYTAQAVLIVRLGPEYMYQSEVAHSSGAVNQLIPFNRDQIFSSEVAILNSADVHREVIEAVGMEHLLPNIHHRSRIGRITARLREMLGDAPSAEQLQRQRMAAMLDWFNRRFAIALANESAVITVRFEHASDAVAVTTLDTLLKRYFEKRRELYRDPRVELAESQLQKKREESAASEQALAAFKARYHIIAFEEQRSELLRQRDAARAMAVNISHPGLSGKIVGYNTQLAELNAQETELKLLQAQAAADEKAVAQLTQTRDEARAYEARLREHAENVRMVQSPTTPAKPKSWQGTILVLGAVISALFALVVGVISAHAYDTGKVVMLLQQRRKYGGRRGM